MIIFPAIRDKKINIISKKLSEALNCKLDGSGSIYKRICKAKRNNEPYIIIRHDTPHNSRVTYNDGSVNIDIKLVTAIKLARGL